MSNPKPTLPPARPVTVRSQGWSRRRFGSHLLLSSASLAALPWLGSGCQSPGLNPFARRRKVALLATEVRKFSHAQHFIDRLLEGYGWQGQHHEPPLELAGLYVDQFPDGDLARERAARHQVRLFPTIPETLTLGGSRLAVDGVLIIGEHGRYPDNDLGQKLYPRYAWFKEVVRVFEASGRAVPVFNDKHLSTSWREAVDMVEDSRRLGFAFLAGSSLPVTWRLPSLDFPYGEPLRESVCACYGGVDSYDFHGLETAQCMSERRAGGETGVQSILALRGPAVWQHLSSRDHTRDLLMAALCRSHTISPPAGYTVPPLSLDWIQEKCPDPIAYFIRHRDGLQTSMFLLNGLITDFNYAGMLGSGRVISTQFHLPMPPRLTTLADFFNPLMHHIERCVLTHQAPYPIERTLLTTGMTEGGVRSLRSGREIATPEMQVTYQPSSDSHFWRS